MHDFHLARQIVRLARQHARDHGLAQIKKIVIELGGLIEHGEQISPENLQFNIKLLLPCQVKIKKIKGGNWRLVNIEGK